MRIVVALGGNALLRRGEALSIAAQGQALEAAARVLAGAIGAGHQLIVTHGNGPQVGLLALQAAAGPAGGALPLDVLGAESEGWIGYGIELALRNALPEGAGVVTLLTQTLVDPEDGAFAHPTKPIGPVYDADTADALAAAQGWTIAPDGKFWRRVVPSPPPRGIVELAAILALVERGVTVICAGGGGIPVRAGRDGQLAGVEAVIDKDATSALLARETRADLLVMLTDVGGVYLDFGGAAQRRIGEISPEALEAQAATFPAGSMGPKVAAACRFVRETGGSAAIGALDELLEMIEGRSGTRIVPTGGHFGVARLSEAECPSTGLPR